MTDQVETKSVVSFMHIAVLCVLFLVLICGTLVLCLYPNSDAFWILLLVLVLPAVLILVLATILLARVYIHNKKDNDCTKDSVLPKKFEDATMNDLRTDLDYQQLTLLDLGDAPKKKKKTKTNSNKKSVQKSPFLEFVDDYNSVKQGVIDFDNLPSMGEEVVEEKETEDVVQSVEVETTEKQPKEKKNREKKQTQKREKKEKVKSVEDSTKVEQKEQDLLVDSAIVKAENKIKPARKKVFVQHKVVTEKREEYIYKSVIKKRRYSDSNYEMRAKLLRRFFDVEKHTDTHSILLEKMRKQNSNFREKR